MKLFLPIGFLAAAAAVGTSAAAKTPSTPLQVLNSMNVNPLLHRAMTDHLFPSSTTSPAAHHRSLQTSWRQCNTKIGVMTRDEIVSVLGIIFQDDPQIVSLIGPVLKYDVASYKICGSCQDMGGESLPEACGPGAYGYDAQHSSLVLVPVDGATGKFVQGSLRAAKVYHGTRVDVEDVATNTFPDSLQGLQSGDPEVIGAILSSIGEVSVAAASAGSVVIAPDYLGYGESQSSHNRTYLVRQSYEQAAIVSWLATQKWLSIESGGCTQLENTASIEGTSEGGYGALSASSVLDEMGVRILAAQLNTAALSMEKISLWMMTQYDNGLISPDKANSAFPVFTPMNSWAYSQDLPHLANSGYPNQTLLASDWMVEDDFDRNIAMWLESPDPISAQEIFALMPPFAPDIFQPAIIQLIRDAIAINSTTPCSSIDGLVERGVDKLCEAISDNDLTSLLSSVTFPAELCFSQEDTVIPAFQFTDELFENSYVTRAVGPDGAPIAKDGDHGEASITCIFANLISYLTSGMIPGTDQSDLPFSVTPLEGGALESCLAPSTDVPAPTPGSTSVPAGSETTTMAPTTGTSTSTGTPVQEPTAAAPSDSSGASFVADTRTCNVLVGVFSLLLCLGLNGITLHV